MPQSYGTPPRGKSTNRRHVAFDGREVAFCQFHIGLLAEVNELFEQIEPRPRPLGDAPGHFWLAELFLRDSSLARASCLRSLQNSASAGLESPELSPSRSKAS